MYIRVRERGGYTKMESEREKERGREIVRGLESRERDGGRERKVGEEG